MSLFSRLTRGIHSLIFRRREEQDLDEELRAYLSQAIEEKRRTGLGRDEAVRAARGEMGSLSAAKDYVRDVGWESSLESIWQDVRYAFRGLRRSPGFAAVAILTLALGIGANTAIYSAIDAAFFRPLPFPQPERLVRVSDVIVPLDLRGLTPVGTSNNVQPTKTHIELRDLYGLRSVFSSSAAYATGGFNLGTGLAPLRVDVTFVTTEFFEVLGRRPVLGRVFTAEETSLNGPKVTVLSYRLWRSQFGADPAIVGKRVTLDEVAHEVVGVMPEDFRFPAVTQLWVPLPVPVPSSITTAFRNFLPAYVIARLAPEVIPSVAGERLDVIRQPYIEAFNASLGPTRRRPSPVTPAAELVTPVQRWLVGDRRPALTILMVSAGLVLLVACVNVATLLLAHGATRRSELATRLALGASRARLLRQLLIESVMVSLAGAALGLAVAATALPALGSLLPAGLDGLASPAIDRRVLAFTIAVAIATGVAFGLWPAIGSSRQDPTDVLAGSSSRTATGTSRVMQVLVVVEVALACLLVIGAGLMLTSLRALLTTETGMRVDTVATARLTLPSQTYRESQVIAGFVQSVLARLREAPGVVNAAAVNTLPLGQEPGISLLVVAEGRTEVFDKTRFAPYLVVSPGYFRTMGIPLTHGRDLAWADGRALPVAVINRTMAQTLWPAEEAIGKRFVFGAGTSRTVVGVVEDVRASDLSVQAGLQVYLPIQEQPQSYLSLVAQGADRGDMSALLAQIATAVRRVDATLPVYAAQSMEAVVAATVAPRRLNTLLIGAFGVLALFLAAVGVYGVLAYSVVQRTREIGIRAAIGARRAEIVGLVVRRGLLLALWGIGLGTGTALATTRFLQAMLYGVTPRDATTFIAAAVVFASVTLLASALPGWRAAKVDPLTALRCQ